MNVQWRARVPCERAAESQVVGRRTDGHSRARRAGHRATSEDQQQPRSKKEDKPVDARAKEIGGGRGGDRKDVRKGPRQSIMRARR